MECPTQQMTALPDMPINDSRVPTTRFVFLVGTQPLRTFTATRGCLHPKASQRATHLAVPLSWGTPSPLDR